MSWLVVLALAPVAVVVGVVVVRQPLRVGLPLYAAVIPFGGALSLGPSRYGSASSLLGLLVAVGVAGQLLAGRRAAARWPPAVTVWLLFLGLAMATSMWTVDRAETVRGLLVLGPLVVVFALVACAQVDREVVRRTENGILMGGVAVVGYGLYQLVVLGGFFSDRPGGGVEEGGRFGNGMLGPNIQSVTLLLPLALALQRAVVEPRRATRLASLGVAALALLGILMTGSRTGSLGAAVVLLGLILTSPRGTRRRLVAALALGVVAAGAIWVFEPLGLTQRSFESATSSSGRSDIWEVGLSACPEMCIIGSGWGTFPEVYADQQASVPGARVLTGDEGSYQPHNLWLLTLVETGVVGTLLFTGGLLLGLREALRLPAEHRGAAAASLLGLAFALMFLSSMEFKIFWMVLLLITLYGNLLAEERTARGGSTRIEAPQPMTPRTPT